MFTLPSQRTTPQLIFFMKNIQRAFWQSFLFLLFLKKGKCSYSGFYWKKFDSAAQVVICSPVLSSNDLRQRPVLGSAWPESEHGFPAVRCRKKRWSWLHQWYYQWRTKVDSGRWSPSWGVAERGLAEDKKAFLNRSLKGRADDAARGIWRLMRARCRGR